MKTLARWIAPLALGLLCGCLQVQDDLTLQPDGSGSVKMIVRNSIPEELISMLGLSGRYGAANTPLYPPLNETDARRFFPAKDFTLKIEQTSADDTKSLLVDAGFKNVNALLASPYGRSHQLTLKTNAQGILHLQMLTGASALAQATKLKTDDEMTSMNLPGLEEAQKTKGTMRFQFRVTLPDLVTDASAPHEATTATWTFDRAQCKDDDEFASKLSAVLEASCRAAGIHFSPATPPRLGLLPFSALSAGKANAASILPDTNKVVAAARYVPYALHVTRSLDLSGEGGAQASTAQLTGAILLPSELVPQRWGQIKLEEAIDAGGTSLMPKENDSMTSRVSPAAQYEMGVETEEELSETNATNGIAKPYIVTLNFKAPEWKVKQISKIRAVVELEYLGGSEIIKLSNAVPAGLVKDISKRSASSFGFDSERGQIIDPELSRYGLVLRVQMAAFQSGMTTISLETTGRKAGIVDAQIFDKEGKPWPTVFTQSDPSGGPTGTCQLMVAGQPAPPFSLALEVGGVGASVGLPIQVENLPLSDQ